MGHGHEDSHSHHGKADKHTGIFPLLPVGLIIFGVITEIAAILSPRFVDWYVTRIFPLWPATLGRLTSLLPFSVGEWMLVAALLWLMTLAGVTVISLVRRIVKPQRSDSVFARFRNRFYRATLWLLAIFLPVMMFNCFICYQRKPMEQHLRGTARNSDPALSEARPADTNPPQTGTPPAGTVSAEAERITADINALTALRDHAVIRCNTLAETLPRTPDGKLSAPDRLTLIAGAQSAVSGLSPEIPSLSGFQVRLKPLFFSGFVSQQYMSGYYFPFSMEANFNALMEPVNLPFTMCHELAHTHGFLPEDEANFIGWLACVKSGDDFMEYSGWLGVLYYLNRDLKQVLGDEAYAERVQVSPRVMADHVFLTPDTWASVESHALFRTETVSQAADTYVNITLKANGIPAGKESYAQVVRLMLLYGLP